MVGFNISCGWGLLHGAMPYSEMRLFGGVEANSASYFHLQLGCRRSMNLLDVSREKTFTTETRFEVGVTS